MAPMSKGVLNPFLRPDNRRGSDSGRFDSIKGVVTIACSVKVACKRLFKASFSLFLLLFLSVRRKKRNISLLFIYFYLLSFLSNFYPEFRISHYRSTRAFRGKIVIEQPHRLGHIIFDFDLVQILINIPIYRV